MAPPTDWDAAIRYFARLALASCALVVGLYLIYAFGAGYFGYVAVPTPANFVVSMAMVCGLLTVLWRYVTRP